MILKFTKEGENTPTKKKKSIDNLMHMIFPFTQQWLFDVVLYRNVSVCVHKSHGNLYTPYIQHLLIDAFTKEEDYYNDDQQPALNRSILIT